MDKLVYIIVHGSWKWKSWISFLDVIIDHQRSKLDLHLSRLFYILRRACDWNQWSIMSLKENLENFLEHYENMTDLSSSLDGSDSFELEFNVSYHGYSYFSFIIVLL